MSHRKSIHISQEKVIPIEIPNLKSSLLGVTLVFKSSGHRICRKQALHKTNTFEYAYHNSADLRKPKSYCNLNKNKQTNKQHPQNWNTIEEFDPVEKNQIIKQNTEAYKLHRKKI